LFDDEEAQKSIELGGAIVAAGRQVIDTGRLTRSVR